RTPRSGFPRSHFDRHAHRRVHRYGIGSRKTFYEPLDRRKHRMGAYFRNGYRAWVCLFLKKYINRFYIYSIAFNPTAPAMIHSKKAIRFQSVDSLKNKIPIRTAPAAPSPVHIAYAVPRGISRMASDRKKKPPAKDKTTKKSRAKFFFWI